MTLREIYGYLEALALQVPGIRTVVRNDVLRLNEMREAEYGVFAITQDRHTFAENGWVTYALNLFYIDRLLNDRSNELEVQSHGMEVLRAIVQRAREDMVVGDASYTPFTERFQDWCAGCWCTVSFSLPFGDCNDIFREDDV